MTPCNEHQLEDSDTLWDEFPNDKFGLESQIDDEMDGMHPGELFSLLGDGGMVGECAQREATNRGWEFNVEVEHGDGWTSTHVRAMNDLAKAACHVS